MSVFIWVYFYFYTASVIVLYYHIIVLHCMRRLERQYMGLRHTNTILID